MTGLRVHPEWRAIRSLWVRDDALADLLILRGAVLWSYAHAEQVVTEIMVRCAHHPAYRDIASKPPFSLKQRRAFLRAVLDRHGPLAPYRQLGDCVLKRIEASREIRNRMAHADMTTICVSGREFRELHIDGGEITYRRTSYWPGELERHALKAGRFSRACHRLLAGIDALALLPPIPMGEAQPV